jgi:hypothetical protein
MAQSVDWLSAGLRLQLGVHRKWSSDCQTGALDPKPSFRQREKIVCDGWRVDLRGLRSGYTFAPSTAMQLHSNEISDAG